MKINEEICMQASNIANFNHGVKGKKQSDYRHSVEVEDVSVTKVSLVL